MFLCMLLSWLLGCGRCASGLEFAFVKVVRFVEVTGSVQGISRANGFRGLVKAAGSGLDHRGGECVSAYVAVMVVRLRQWVPSSLLPVKLIG